MGWLAKILGAVGREEMDGIQLDVARPFWELTGKTDFPRFLRALGRILPDGSMLYLEGGSPNGQLRSFLSEREVPEQSHVAFGTLWPRPRVSHVPATPENTGALARLAESCAGPELAIHLHVYCDGKVLLQWHDAPDDPILLSGDIAEDQVRPFAQALSMSYTRREGGGQQGLSGDRRR